MRSRKSGIELTDRDKVVLKLCHDYAYVDSLYLKETVFFDSSLDEKTKTVTNLRLKKLQDGGYLSRFLRADTNYSNRDTVYTLGPEGEKFMHMEHGYCDYNSAWRKSLKIWFNHALSILRIAESVKEQLAKSSEYTFIEFVPEVRAFFQYGDGRKDVIRPDGLIIIGDTQNKKDNICLFLEVENSVSTYRVIKAKMERYEAFLASTARKKKYENKVTFEQPVSHYMPLFVTSDKISAPAVVEKLIRYKEDIEIEASALFESLVLVAAQKEVTTNFFAPIYWNISNENVQEKISLFNE